MLRLDGKEKKRGGQTQPPQRFAAKQKLDIETLLQGSIGTGRHLLAGCAPVCPTKREAVEHKMENQATSALSTTFLRLTLLKRL